MKLTSPNGRYETVLQDDGNLVTYRAGVPIWASGPDPDPPPVPPVTPASVPLIRASGTTLIDAPSGHLWKWRGTSAFRLFDDYLHGVDIDPFCQWVVSRRLNLVRVFAMYCGRLGRLLPYHYLTYFTDLDRFLAHVTQRGVSVEMVLFADMGTDELRRVDPQRHYADMMDVLLGRTGVVAEVCNEPFVNGFEPTTVYQPFSELVQALGHYVPNGGTLPHAQFVTVHSSRDEEWPRKPGKNCLELSRLGWDGYPPLGVPAVEDEPMGIGDGNGRSMVASDHAQAHAAAHLFGCGSTIHSTFGLETRLPTDAEDEIVRAVVQSWEAVPPACQTWTYTAGHLSTCPLADTALRTYGMVQEGRAVVVRIRPTTAPVAVNGWRIVSERGYQGCVVELVQ